MFIMYENVFAIVSSFCFHLLLGGFRRFKHRDVAQVEEPLKECLFFLNRLNSPPLTVISTMVCIILWSTKSCHYFFCVNKLGIPSINLCCRLTLKNLLFIVSVCGVNLWCSCVILAVKHRDRLSQNRHQECY